MYVILPKILPRCRSLVHFGCRPDAEEGFVRPISLPVCISPDERTEQPNVCTYIYTHTPKSLYISVGAHALRPTHTRPPSDTHMPSVRHTRALRPTHTRPSFFSSIDHYYFRRRTCNQSTRRAWFSGPTTSSRCTLRERRRMRTPGSGRDRPRAGLCQRWTRATAAREKCASRCGFVSSTTGS